MLSTFEAYSRFLGGRVRFTQVTLGYGPSCCALAKSFPVLGAQLRLGERLREFTLGAAHFGSLDECQYVTLANDVADLLLNAEEAA